MKAATLVALALLAALCSASHYNSNSRIDDRDSQQQRQQAQPFRAGYEYSFVYNGQISSGLEVSGPNKAPASSDEPQQQAVTRIQAEAKIAFETEQQATLRLERIRVGQLNEQIESPQQVQPMGMFEQKNIEESKLHKLQLPVQFSYNNGVVERVQFQSGDAAWSKNIKRAVLNLIQLNLKKQPTSGGDQQQQQQWSSEEQQDEQDGQQSSFQTFTLPEITIEGNCLTTYTVSNRQNGQSSQEQDDQSGEQQQQRSQYFNVTKTIDFKKCKKIADVAFGFQNQQQQPQCQKCKSAQQQQQQQQYGPQQQQSQTCSEECDPKEIKEQQLDRTTAIRFVLNGKSPQQSYGIKRAELISQYVYKNLRSASATMQTVVAAELVFRSSQQKQQRQSFQPATSSQKDTLLYDNEWDEEEKRFYMNGDEDFNQRSSPFANVPKQEQVVQIIRKVAQDATDKINGLESRDAAKLHDAVELLRMCSVPELRHIYEQIADRQSSSIVQKKAHQIVADCLALAGTRNTILVLTEKITSNSLDNRQAFQAIRQLSNLPAPSDKQADIVLHTCQNEAVNRNKALKQACWLTFGSMVGELCQQKTQTSQESVPIFGAQSGFSSPQQCSRTKKQSFKQALLDQFHRAQNTYEKVLALKALGNAGIDTTAQALEQIINNQQENRIVRAQAIDALRRLRTQMPRKIQRILLPVLQNTREHPAVRMSALAMILHTTPERAILDQVAYTLNKERNPQVQAFAYTALKSLSKSKVPCQQRMAKQLKTALKLTNVDEQTLQSSRVHHIPIYSQEQNEGVFINLVSSFSHRNNMLPNHLAAVVDTMINDEFELNNLKVALTQQGLDQWYEGLVQSLLKGQSQNQARTRGQRSSSNPRQNQEELRQIFTGLKIKPRRSAFQYDQDDEEDNQQNGQGQRRQQKQPFAMITTRVGDRDTAILPLDSKSMPQCLKRLAQGQQVSLAECLSAVQTPLHFNAMSVMNLNEKCAKIPTSMGLPLRILQTMPVLATAEGEIRVTADRSQGAGIKAQVKAHVIATALHIQKMDTWTPMISTGVEISRAAELNVPVEAEIQVSAQGAFKAAMKTPKTKSRVLGFHSLPTTFAMDYDSRTHLLKEKRVKAVQMPQFEQFQRDVDTTLGSKHTGDIFRIEGHVHQPRNPTDFKQLLQLSMCTENHLHFKFDPESAPEEITVRVDLDGFNKASSTGPSLDTYKQSSDFSLMNDEQDFEQPETHDQRRSKLNAYQSKFQSPMYKHQMTLVVEAKGGRNDHKAQIQASAECDSKLQFCHVKMDLKRSPILASENTDWTLRSEAQIVFPEAVSNANQLRQSKYQKVNADGEIEWGCEDKQSIKFRLHGENQLSKQWRQQIEQLDAPQQKFQEKQTAFINKYDIAIEYQLNHHTQMKLYECFEYVKAYCGAGYWNTDVKAQQGPNGKVSASAFIDPMTMQHVTVVVQTPNQRFRCENVQLYGKVRPFSLVRPEQKQIHSVSHLMNRLAVGSGRAECSVNGKRVETFDDVLYKAPIGKCYSVLAKDCSSEQQPQFAVMMKTLSNGKDKKIKIVTPEQMIECQPEKDDQQKHLQCKVNGQIINPNDNTEQQDSYYGSQGAPTVQFNNEDQTDVTINVEGVQVRFGCWGSQNCKDQKAWIKLSSQYKEGQCGLCGHYDEQADNEWRMPDNQEAKDMQQFHRSYSLRNGNEDDCSAQEQSDFYSKQNSHNFRQIGWDSQEDDDQAQFDDELSGSQLSRKNIQNYDDEEQDQDNEEQNQWQAGAYHSDGSSSEEDQWGRQGSQMRKKVSMIKKKASLKKRQQKNQQADQDNSEEPIQVTKVQEFHQQVCFSEKPVKQCPEGTQPTQEKQPANVRFVCLPRTSPETRQMQRQARQGKIVDTTRYESNSVEALREPIACY